MQHKIVRLAAVLGVWSVTRRASPPGGEAEGQAVLQATHAQGQQHKQGKPGQEEWHVTD